MTKFDTFRDFADKVDWEGGVLESINYGLRAEDIPSDAPEGFADVWLEAQAIYYLLDPKIDQLEATIEDFVANGEE